MSSQVPPQPSDSKSPREHAALVAPQFRLSTLLVLITAVGVLLGAAVVLPPLVTSGLFLLLVAVIAHVAGNYYGTKLRDGATALGHARRNDPAAQPAWQEEVLRPRHAKERSRLTDRAPVGIAVAVFIAVGATISVGVGTYFLNGAQIEPMAWPDFLMGCFAFAVLGGIWGFAVGGFVCIGYRAVRHAIQQSNRPDE